ncbi:MAG: WhiB family transcriptional regulator [Nocardioidaceae bacterium]
MTSAASWKGDAACRAHDPDLFYPVGQAEPARRETAAAQRVCAVCPVAAQCLEWALIMPEAHGIWGGTTPEERRLSRANWPSTTQPQAANTGES